RTGEHHVLDVNPRLGAQHRLFSARGGMDVVRAAHSDLSGRTVHAAAPPDGRTYLVENLDQAAARRYIRDGRIGASAWWRTVWAADEYAWFARDDPLPFLAMGVRSVVEGTRRRTARAARGIAARGIAARGITARGITGRGGGSPHRGSVGRSGTRGTMR